VGGKLYKNATIGSPGFKETAPTVFALLPVRLWHFEFTCANVDSPLGFSTLLLAGQQAVDVCWLKAIFDDLDPGAPFNCWEGNLYRVDNAACALTFHCNWGLGSVQRTEWSWLG